LLVWGVEAKKGILRFMMRKKAGIFEEYQGLFENIKRHYKYPF
jgi:hypothetical protein